MQFILASVHFLSNKFIERIKKWSYKCWKLLSVSIFFEMTERFRMDEERFKILSTSLVLCFYSFFTMVLTLNLSNFWQFWLWVGLIIDNLNNIVNNLDSFCFLDYPNRYTNWVAYLGTQHWPDKGAYSRDLGTITIF